MAASTELGILFTLAQDSQGTGLRESHFRGQRFQARQFQVSGFCLNLLTLGPAVSLLMCKWVTNQGDSPSPLQDKNSMRNTLYLVITKNGSFQEKLSKRCSPNPKKMMTSHVSMRIRNCLQLALLSPLPVPSPCQCFPPLASPPPVPSSFRLPARLSHSGFWVFLPARV